MTSKTRALLQKARNAIDPSRAGHTNQHEAVPCLCVRCEIDQALVVASCETCNGLGYRKYEWKTPRGEDRMRVITCTTCNSESNL